MVTRPPKWSTASMARLRTSAGRRSVSTAPPGRARLGASTAPARALTEERHGEGSRPWARWRWRGGRGVDGQGGKRNEAWRGGLRWAWGGGQRRRWRDRAAAAAMDGVAGV